MTKSESVSYAYVGDPRSHDRGLGNQKSKKPMIFVSKIS